MRKKNEKIAALRGPLGHRGEGLEPQCRFDAKEACRLHRRNLRHRNLYCNQQPENPPLSRRNGRFSRRFDKIWDKAGSLCRRLRSASLCSLHQRGRVQASGADSKRADFSRISGHSSSAPAQPSFSPSISHAATSVQINAASEFPRYKPAYQCTCNV